MVFLDGFDSVVGVLGMAFGGIAAFFGWLGWRRGRPQISTLQTGAKGGKIYCRIHVQPGMSFDQVLMFSVPGFKVASAFPNRPEAAADDVLQQSPFLDVIPLGTELEPGMGHKNLYFILETKPKKPFRVCLRTSKSGNVFFDVGPSAVDDIAHKFETQCRFEKKQNPVETNEEKG